MASLADQSGKQSDQDHMSRLLCVLNQEKLKLIVSIFSKTCIKQQFKITIYNSTKLIKTEQLDLSLVNVIAIEVKWFNVA